ncbi:MAG: sulfite exporter TauE/SafE family protein [Clostridia bacterium]|nr:sulfite exporter TauE/SafE family protein [Clostridia bacterium]
MIKYLLIALFGAFSGILGGMGLGGGTLLIPLLTTFSGVEQQIAQSANLIAFIPSSIIALSIHGKNKTFKTEGLAKIIIPAVACSVVFGFLISGIRGNTLKKIFGGFLCVLSIIQFLVGKKTGSKRTNPRRDI